MPSLNDLAAERTDLGPADLEWLHRLVADWQLLADLSFADLLLWLPARDGSGFWAGAQMRPTTGPTVYYDDRVGTFLPGGRRPQVDDAYARARICRERDPEWRDDLPIREETIPVVRQARVIAVISRHTNLAAARTPSRLELTYLQTAGDLARMIAEGSFPFADETVGGRAAPRVGDGLVRLDATGVVTYASPNAVSAYRRIGLAADLVGQRLGELTASLAPSVEPVEEGLARALVRAGPRTLDVGSSGVVLTLRSIPLLVAGQRIGTVVLLRDVSEIRRRERELVTKDATIREIHHRVKNNLATVAALLRLQARRLDEPHARAALDEAVRRVATIATVHETLAMATQDRVCFDEIADRLLDTLVDVAAGATSLQVRRIGSVGEVPAEVATPLAMALSELAQNAVEHGLVGGVGSVTVQVSRTAGPRTGTERLVVDVVDDGRGLPPEFDLTGSARLGLQIVRSLVEIELGGRLTLSSADGRGTRATIEVEIGV
ncbi:MAG: histidine kinase N-terminal domain-containing protein [Actinomycetes bacterium]